LEADITVAKTVANTDKGVDLRLVRSRQLKEVLIERFFFVNGVLAILILGGIFIVSVLTVRQGIFPVVFEKVKEKLWSQRQDQGDG